MPCTPRHCDQRARRNEIGSSFPFVKKSRKHGRHVLPDGSVLQVTVSDTGKGTHWRWNYPEANEAETAVVVSSASSSPNAGRVEDYSQDDRFITPASSVQQLSPSIQKAPRRRKKHRQPRLASAPTPIRPPIAPEDMILWGKKKDLETPKPNSSSDCPGRHALGPHGTWLVDDDGHWIIILLFPSRFMSMECWCNQVFR